MNSRFWRVMLRKRGARRTVGVYVKLLLYECLVRQYSMYVYLM